jgi:hypothetical protein
VRTLSIWSYTRRWIPQCDLQLSKVAILEQCTPEICSSHFKGQTWEENEAGSLGDEVSCPVYCLMRGRGCGGVAEAPPEGTLVIIFRAKMCLAEIGGKMTAA